MVQAIDMWTGKAVVNRFENDLFQLRRKDPEPDLKALIPDEVRPLVMVTWAVDR